MACLILRAVLSCLVLALAGCATPSTKPALGVDLLEMERRAAQAYVAGDYAQASELYAGIVESMPDQAEYWYRLGNAYARQGLDQEAALSYRQSLALDSSNARAWHNLGMMHLKLANASFLSGQRRGSTRVRAHEENARLAKATSRILEEGSAAAQEPPAGAAPATNAPHEEAGGTR